MDWSPRNIIRWLFESSRGPADRFLARWIVLRALGLIYFSAFFSLVFQIRGLIGPHGILPAREYLQVVARSFPHGRFWYAPTLLWIANGNRALLALCWVGMIASLLVVFNVWPRAALFVCLAGFLSFIAAAGDFSSYQSDGMLLEAGFLALFFAPPGLRPGLARGHPPIRASHFLLLWECFRIYFESGVVKLASGEAQWRNFTAMDEYYQNGPLPTWIGWYAQHLPHWFHAATAFSTLALELALCWMFFLPRRFRIICFCIITPWQIGVILTANYTFLNYLVLFLGFLLLDDRFLAQFLPSRWRKPLLESGSASALPVETLQLALDSSSTLRVPSAGSAESPSELSKPQRHTWRQNLRAPLAATKLTLATLLLAWVFYATTSELVWILLPSFPLPTGPVLVLEPFRVANQYGLFAVMTRNRYEIEFQGSNDGQNWTAYPFRFKPQDPAQPPGIYAPYQPRFDWNLWFASLDDWRRQPIVPRTEMRLADGSPDVLALFAGDPFHGRPPREVRAVLWQYWFTSVEEERGHGLWWRREFIGLYAPSVARLPDGQLQFVQ